MTNKELKELIKIFESSSLSRMKLDKGEVTIELEKAHKVIKEVVQAKENVIEVPAQVPNVKEEPVKTYDPVKAPLVGTFYEAPAPDQPPFARVGQFVKKGDPLFIIEAMKVMNEITSPKDGKIMAIHVKNADMVMYDQVVMEIE
jgi:acetyl-CoA carboxylase biotin carboxyl carrier protein